MGLASGYLKPGENLCGHPVIEAARGEGIEPWIGCMFKAVKWEPFWMEEHTCLLAALSSNLQHGRSISLHSWRIKSIPLNFNFTDITSTGLLFASEVSDAAAGGQVFLEETTYKAVKDNLGELGTVDTQVKMLKSVMIFIVMVDF